MLNRRSFLSFLPKAIAGMKLAPLVPVDPFSDWVMTKVPSQGPFIYGRTYGGRSPGSFIGSYGVYGVDVASGEDHSVVTIIKQRSVGCSEVDMSLAEYKFRSFAPVAQMDSAHRSDR